MNTNGIDHNLKVGALVWSAGDMVYRIKNITVKRIVCEMVGKYEANGIRLFTKRQPLSNHTPDNLFNVEPTVPMLNKTTGE